MPDLKLDMADARPSLMTAMVVLLIVIVGIPFLKWLVGEKFQVPGLNNLVNSV
jgi:hypothetical protein